MRSPFHIISKLAGISRTSPHQGNSSARAWSVRRTSLDNRTVRVTLTAESSLDTSDVLGLLETNAVFRTFFTKCIIDSGFEAFFLEMPPLTLGTLGRPFEFVVIEGGGLSSLRPDPLPFSEHFSNGCPDVLSFPNLRKDADLLVPAPITSDHSCYTHLGRFLRTAPPRQIDLFWQTMATAVRKRLSDSPMWLSTAGMGVSWLHLRLDSTPKYYRHQAYKKFG